MRSNNISLESNKNQTSNIRTQTFTPWAKQKDNCREVSNDISLDRARSRSLAQPNFTLVGSVLDRPASATPRRYEPDTLVHSKFKTSMKT